MIILSNGSCSRCLQCPVSHPPGSLISGTDERDRFMCVSLLMHKQHPISVPLCILLQILGALLGQLNMQPRNVGELRPLKKNPQ